MFYLFRVDRFLRSFKDWKLADIIIYLQNLTAAVSHKTDHNSYSFSKLFFLLPTQNVKKSFMRQNSYFRASDICENNVIEDPK